ncbi:MAG: AraC family transcriptional regulator [Lachnospiraceae bacterium]|nr:AraC family transcriptional regulator [Lachnospiraceae bacterium]
MQQNDKKYPFFSMVTDDGLYISFEKWTDSRSVDMHRHNYYELLIVANGSCHHIYNGTETLLIPGDVVVVSERKAHGFSLSGECTFYNCQFRLIELDPRVVNTLRDSGYLFNTAEAASEEEQQWEQSLVEREQHYHDRQLQVSYELNNTRQGVLHLSPSELTFILSLLQQGLDQQEEHQGSHALIRVKCLEMILLELEKARSLQNQKYHVCSRENQKAIAAVLLHMEAHLDEPVEFNELAEKYSFSPNHFRKIFKDVTGFSPVTYMNRLRIIRACDYIQNQGKSIHEAAELVGIYDLNYFSRLFKKIMGCSPSKL